MRYRTFLQIYKACLGLLPNAIKQRHAEQMYLTAQDMLQDTRGAAGCVRIVQLVGDLGHGLIHEHTKQLARGDMNKQLKLTPASAKAAALLGLEVVIVPVLAFVGIKPVIRLFTVPHYMFSIYAIGDILQQLLPLIMTGIAFHLLGKLGLRLWNRIVSSFVIGCAATYVFYSLGMSIIMRIWEVWPVLHGQFGFVFVWACTLAYIGVFYLIGAMVMDRLMLKPAGQIAPAK